MIAKIIMVIDIIVIVITAYFIGYYGNGYGYDALRMFLIALCYFGAELLLLIIVFIIMIYKNHRNK
ncbi:MAG: hypothetical protein HDR03_03325 [Lachnospiraceae bacterium]|nr:hypothetical protein [Lachnospiraceae bacterium]